MHTCIHQARSRLVIPFVYAGIMISLFHIEYSDDYLKSGDESVEMFSGLGHANLVMPGPVILSVFLGVSAGSYAAWYIRLQMQAYVHTHVHTHTVHACTHMQRT